jgi:hypothetical protein
MPCVYPQSLEHYLYTVQLCNTRDQVEIKLQISSHLTELSSTSERKNNSLP